jgi:hypothetical protein
MVSTCTAYSEVLRKSKTPTTKDVTKHMRKRGLLSTVGGLTVCSQCTRYTRCIQWTHILRLVSTLVLINCVCVRDNKTSQMARNERSVISWFQILLSQVVQLVPLYGLDADKAELKETISRIARIRKEGGVSVVVLL